MTTELIDPWAALLRYGLAVMLALATVTGARVGVRDLATRQTADFEVKWDEFERSLVAGLRLVVVRMLLPFSAGLALLESGVSYHFWLLLVIGAVATCFLYLLLLGLYRLLSQDDFAWRAAAAASMGGGNRGLAALVLVITVGVFSKSEQQESLLAFYAFDMGNFIVLLAVIPIFIRVFITPPQSPDGTVDDLERKAWTELLGRLAKRKGDLIPIGLVIVLSPILSGLKSQGLNEVFAVIDENTKDLRGQLLLYLPWVWIFLSWPNKSIRRASFKEAFFLSVFRLSIVLFFIFGWSRLDLVPKDIFWEPTYLAAIVLFLSPVSSYARTICEESGAGKATVDRIAALVVMSTLLFVVMLMIFALAVAVLPR